MKAMKKFVGLMLALVMVFAMTTSVFAAQEGTLTDGSITIKDAVPGQTYNAYQILYLESYNAKDNAYAYKANSAWESWLKTMTTYVKIDAQGYVTWVGETSDARVAAFAKEAQKQLAGKTADATAEAQEAGEGETYSTVELKNLKLGYYLVDTTLGTLCSLDTTNPSVEMEEKNAVPENVKTVEEDSTGNYGAKNDADIGQTVNYKSTITAQAGAENYVFHDKMTAGLTYIGVTGITLNGSIVDASKYTVTAPAADGDTFDVVFTQAFCDTLKANDQIVISYSATVNENAVVAGDGNSNTSKLGYGDSSNTKTTPDSTTKTYTWDVDIFKYTKKDNEEKPLAGAKFTLSKKADGTEPITLVAEGNNVYRVAKTGETGTVTEITTDTTGKFTIEGLDADTYYLTEKEAPNGYNKLAGPITIVIGADGQTSVNSTVVGEVKVQNNSGTELPTTGGMGTTVLYIAGALLVLLAVVLLFVKRRRSDEA